MALTLNPTGIICPFDGSGGQVAFAFITDAPSGTTHTALLLDSGVTVRSASLGTDLYGLFVGLTDGVYELVIIESTGASVSQVVFVECTGSGDSCDLYLGLQGVVPPTASGGQGYIETLLTTTAANADLTVRRTDYPYDEIIAVTVPVAGAVITRRLLGITPGGYQLRALDNNGCVRAFAFRMPDYVPTPTPPITGPPTFYPVGGVLQNPVLCPLSVIYAPGRWVEVQLMREMELLGTGRLTVRANNPSFDAAPYLRAWLSTTPSTGTNVAIDVDASACLEFWYQYRVHESDGTTGNWIEENSMQRYAVLAAMPGISDALAPWVAGAESPGQFTTIFSEGVQFVGLPLSVGLLIPPNLPDEDFFIDFEYLDGAGQQIEIRSGALGKPDAGYYRFLLPSNPLPCAEKVIVSLVNEDRSYEGVCTGGGTTPGVPGGYIVANGGYLKV